MHSEDSPKTLAEAMLYHAKHKNAHNEYSNNDSALIIKNHASNRHYLHDKSKITLRDFIPPVFLKFGAFLKSIFTKHSIDEVTHITYIELGIVIVFIGTILSMILISFYVPAYATEFGYAWQEYINQRDYSSYVSQDVLTKAEQSRAFLQDYSHGVVLGVESPLNVDSSLGGDHKHKTSDRITSNRENVKESPVIDINFQDESYPDISSK